MMQHAPMNTIISICSAALGALYVQVLSLFVILFVYHVAFTPLEIDDPFGAFGMLVLAWFYRCRIGVGASGDQAVVSDRRFDFLDHLSTGQYDRVGQNVCGPIPCRGSCWRCLTGTRSFMPSINHAVLPLSITTRATALGNTPFGSGLSWL